MKNNITLISWKVTIADVVQYYLVSMVGSNIEYLISVKDLRVKTLMPIARNIIDNTAIPTGSTLTLVGTGISTRSMETMADAYSFNNVTRSSLGDIKFDGSFLKSLLSSGHDLEQAIVVYNAT
jgi:hypothetical protein